MDILHWWQIKMVAIQLLCGIGVAWGVRFLVKARRATATIQRIVPPAASIRFFSPKQFSQN